MSRFETQHPVSGSLLAYLDGELPARQAAKVRRHLEACWECRAELEALQNTVAECMRYRKNVLAANLPPPPAPWKDLSRDFSRIDAEIARAPRIDRWRVPGSLRWAAAAAALVLTAGLLFQHFRETPAVQAAALLQRSEAIAQTQPARKRVLQVRTRTRQFTRVVGQPAQAASAPAVASLFITARYDWNDPLSARAFAAWRGTLVGKTDEVSNVPEGYRVRTSAPSGELESASLTLRNTDLHPVQGRFEFRNSEWVELTELAETSTSDDHISALNHVEAPLRRVVPSQPAASSSGSSASISEELQVLAALHEIGADLGDPVEVTRSDGQVLVSGVGLPPQRQTQIERAVGAIPNVAVRFGDPASVAPLPEEPAPPAPRRSSEPKAAGLQSKLQQALGDRANFERFSSQMLDWSDAAMARVYALRALAQRFPAAAEQEIAPADRQVLTDLAFAHASALGKAVADLERALAPVLVSLGGEPAQGQPVTGAAWQATAEDLFRTSRRVEVLLSALVGAAPAANPNQVPSQLLNAIRDLRAETQQCERQLQAR